jgi:hypothetical protein
MAGVAVHELLHRFRLRSLNCGGQVAPYKRGNDSPHLAALRVARLKRFRAMDNGSREENASKQHS